MRRLFRHKSGSVAQVLRVPITSRTSDDSSRQCGSVAQVLRVPITSRRRRLFRQQIGSVAHCSLPLLVGHARLFRQRHSVAKCASPHY
ncbi:hypothetical protein AVEN_233151-1 [Araneus ventricosus]|uniref:Uncharacterized protein n=1 Tax=Araneus ventricosus TaxID=182803 RepID=A0A4Y2PVT1_ARAVE|nr:hypothetical protein AVEN_233151-1 [Araneus ventricosus]